MVGIDDLLGSEFLARRRVNVLGAMLPDDRPYDVGHSTAALAA